MLATAAAYHRATEKVKQVLDTLRRAGFDQGAPMSTFTRDEIDRAFEHYREVAKQAGTA